MQTNKRPKMPSLNKQNPNIDAEWFKAMLYEKRLTIRGLAKLMGLNPSTVSLMLRGIRSIHNEDAIKLAEHLNTTPIEIFRRAGAPVEDEVRRIPMAAYLDADDMVHRLDSDASQSIEAPYDTPTNGYALQVRTGRLYDGWIAIINGNKHTPHDCIGTAAVYCRKDGMMGLGIIRRGYMKDAYNIDQIYTGSGSKYQNVDLLWCQPVVWIKPTQP